MQYLYLSTMFFKRRTPRRFLKTNSFCNIENIQLYIFYTEDKVLSFVDSCELWVPRQEFTFLVRKRLKLTHLIRMAVRNHGVASSEPILVGRKVTSVVDVSATSPCEC